MTAVAKATKAAKAQTKGTAVINKKVRTSPVIRRPKTLTLARSPKAPRKSFAKKEVMHKYNVIKAPLFTDAAMKQIESANTLTFICDSRATKKQIASAVKGLYDVDVQRVNTLIRPDGKKKAYVRFPADVEAFDIANKVGLI